MPVIIIPREEWGAVPPTEPPKPLVHPIRHIFTYPETQQKPCKSKKSCIKRMQDIQKYFMNVRRLPDIKYNFLVGLDGRIYEGTGWFHRPHDDSVSDYEELNNFLSICYIGDFEDYRAPMYAKIEAENLIKLGLEQNYIMPGFKRYMVDFKTKYLKHIKKFVY